MFFFWSLLSLGCLVLAGILLFGNKGLYQLYKLSQERDRLEQKNQEVKAENERLLKTIERLQNDQEMIKDIIRSELHYIKPNERIYHLKPEMGSRTRTKAASKSPQELAKSPQIQPDKTKKAKP
ncbi:MAG: FtsB family cell division protein [Desulfobacteraceae bacterium]